MTDKSNKEVRRVSRRAIIQGAAAAAGVALVACSPGPARRRTMVAHTDENQDLFKMLTMWLIATNTNADFALPLDPKKVATALGMSSPIPIGDPVSLAIQHINQYSTLYQIIRGEFRVLSKNVFKYGDGECPAHSDTLANLLCVDPNTGKFLC